MKQRQTLFYHIAGFGLLGLALLGSDATAQTAVPKAGNVPVSSEPGTTIASYGDWVLRCQRVGAQGKTTRVCEVAEMIQVQGQNTPIAQVAIGRMARGEPLRLTAAVPPGGDFSQRRTDRRREGGEGSRSRMAPLSARRLLRRYPDQGRAAETLAWPERTRTADLQGREWARGFASAVVPWLGPSLGCTGQGRTLRPLAPSRRLIGRACWPTSRKL